MIFFSKKTLDDLIKTRVEEEVEKSARQYIEVMGDGGTEEKEGKEQPTDYEVLYQLYEKVSYVRAVIDTIVRAVVSKGYSFVPTVANPNFNNKLRLETFFGNCNPQDTFIELLADSIRDMLIVGNGYTEIVPENHEPQELWSIDTTTMKIRVEQHGEILGYRQEVDSKPAVDFEEPEVLHFRMPTKGSNPYGLSKLTSLADSLTVDQYARQYNKAFFKRGAKVRGIITMKNATQPQVERNRKYLEAVAKNPTLARGDMIFEGDVAYMPVGTDPKDMDFLNQMKFTRDEVLSVYGVPPAKVSLIETGNIGAGTGESQDRTFHMETVEPLQTQIEWKITKKIIQAGFGIDDWRFEFNRRIVNRKEEAEIHGKYFAMGVLTTEDIREQLGKKTDKTASETEKKIDASSSVVGATPKVISLENTFADDLKRYLADLKKRLIDRLSKIETAKLAAYLATVDQIEKRFSEEEWQDYVFADWKSPKYSRHKAFKQDFPVVAKQLEDAEEIIDEIKTDDIQNVLSKNLLLIAAAGGALAANRMKKKFVPSQDLKDSVATYSGDLAGFLAKEIESSVRSELLAGLQRGEDLTELTARIDKAMTTPAPIQVKPSVDPATGRIRRRATTRHLSQRTRAELVARTETSRFMNKGSLDAFKQAGVTKANIVNPTADKECQPFIDQNPWPIDEAEAILPIHHNCLCTWVPIVE